MEGNHTLLVLQKAVTVDSEQLVNYIHLLSQTVAILKRPPPQATPSFMLLMNKMLAGYPRCSHVHTACNEYALTL